MLYHTSNLAMVLQDPSDIGGNEFIDEVLRHFQRLAQAVVNYELTALRCFQTVQVSILIEDMVHCNHALHALFRLAACCTLHEIREQLALAHEEIDAAAGNYAFFNRLIDQATAPSSPSAHMWPPSVGMKGM